MTPTDDDQPRCPHDGGTCHHDCGNEGERVGWSCFRECQGMSLTTPCEGYPLPGHEPVVGVLARIESELVIVSLPTLVKLLREAAEEIQ